jgi:hypothetical protein
MNKIKQLVGGKNKIVNNSLKVGSNKAPSMFDSRSQDISYLSPFLGGIKKQFALICVNLRLIKNKNLTAKRQKIKL